MLKKFAAFDVLEATLAPANDPLGLHRYAHRHQFTYDPRPGYLYVRSRAISSRCNDNYDEFPAEEIKQAYATFVGKPVFVNHKNENHKRARGVIIDAALHEDWNPDGSPDTWVEVLMEVDAIRFPKLAKAIVDGHIDRTSMGTDVAFSVCSVCNNKATTPLEYCAHIPRMKGQRIYRTTASGKREGILVREICHGLGFFENSLLVEEPADPTAFFTGVEGHGVTASKIAHGDHEHPDTGPYFDGEEDGGLHVHRTRENGEKVTSTPGLGCPHCKATFFNEDARNAHMYDHHPDQPDTGQAEIDQIKRLRGLGAVVPTLDAFLAHEIPISPEDREFYQRAHEDGQRRQEMGEHADKRVVNTDDPHDLKAHLIEAHGWDDNDFHRSAHGDHIALGPQPDFDRPMHHHEIGAVHQWEHREYDDHPDAVTMGNSHFHTAALDVVTAKERKRVQDMEPHELEAFRGAQAAGKKWNQDNPVHADNVIEHWNAATPHEKHAGMNWYKDAHELTKHVANDTGHDMATAAGLMSNYSPQTHWATNMMTAAKAMRLKKGVGGPGSGIFASNAQKHAANKLMGTSGESKTHYETLMKNAPKTRAFARLIHHGGNADPSTPDVVVDRHALSVASGARANDMAYEQSGLSGKKRYAQVADAYHKAAEHISKHTGVKVEAHQVQAATWLVRQRLNAQEDKKTASIAQMGRDATDQWHSYAGEHHPMAMGKEPGTGYATPKDAPEDVHHANDLAAEGGHGSGGMHTPVPSTDRRRKPRLGSVTALGPMPDRPDDTNNTPTSGVQRDSCGTCGKDIYQQGNVAQGGWIHDIDGGAGVPHQAHPQSEMEPIQREAYGETKAPMDVDTLREEECPVCGEADAYDGNECQVCGFVAPPKMFQDPDLDKAKQLDLRKDQDDREGTDPNGDGMPDVIPGTDQPGDNTIDPNDNELADPTDAGQAQVNQIVEEQEPLAPDDITEDGQPIEDPDENLPGDGEPGDLTCPVCGYTADAAPPQTIPTDDQADESQPDGMVEGDVCPNCGQGAMASNNDMEQMAEAEDEQASVDVDTH